MTREINDLIFRGERIMPLGVDGTSFTLNGNLGSLTIRKDWLDVTSYGWMHDNVDLFAQRMRPKAVSEISVTLATNHQFEEGSVHQFECKELNPFDLKIIVCLKWSEGSYLYHCTIP